MSFRRPCRDTNLRAGVREGDGDRAVQPTVPREFLVIDEHDGRVGPRPEAHHGIKRDAARLPDFHLIAHLRTVFRGQRMLEVQTVTSLRLGKTHSGK